MSEYRIKTSEQVGSNMSFEIYDLVRVDHRVVGGSPTHGTHVPIIGRQVKISLKGGSALLEPGALQYAKGNLTVEVQQNERGGNFFSRQIQSAGSGESAFATRYAGIGEVWTEPTRKHFLAGTMDGAGDTLLLDDKAFYACEGTIKISTHTHRSVQGVLSGNGLMQPKMEGVGVFVVESPVPVEEIEVIELNGNEQLIVDGDLMLMYSATLNVELRPLVRGLRNALRTGEGLVYVLSGRGTVFLTPTASIS